jgi:GNAT superfamily N-acetyltransferase
LIRVRRAGPGDAGVLAEMRYAFRSERAVPAEDREPFLERTTGWLADRLRRGSWTGWVACAGPRPVGLVLVQLVEKVPNPVPEPERLGYLSSLYVRPPWRGQGTGGLLLATALEFCRNSGVEAVVLWPSPQSIPLYRRHGFRDRDAVMELRCWAGPTAPHRAGPTAPHRAGPTAPHRAGQSSPELRPLAETEPAPPAIPLDSLCR